MGPLKRLGKRGFKGISEDTEKSIQDALSEAMSPLDTRSMRKKAEDRIFDWARNKQDKSSEFRLTGDVEKYEPGGRVGQCSGDVRYSRSRGKTY